MKISPVATIGRDSCHVALKTEGICPAFFKGGTVINPQLMRESSSLQNNAN